MKEKYIINNDTVVVMSVSSSCSMVYELNCSFKVNCSLKKIINMSCNYFCSSFTGRIEGSKYYLGHSYKLPILLDDYKNIVFFPLKSYRSIDNCIIFLNKIKDYKKCDNGIKILSINDKEIIINYSYPVFENQYLRTQKLLMKIKYIKNI